MQKKRTIARNEQLEGRGAHFGQISMQRDLNLLILFATDTVKITSKLTKGEKELFISFREEQQRINKDIAVRYLRDYLRQQRKMANQMASYLREREKEDRNRKLEDPFWRIPYRIVDIKPVSTSQFQITYDIIDLNKKISLLDVRLLNLRDKITEYEILDYERKNGTLFDTIKIKRKKKAA